MVQFLLRPDRQPDFTPGGFEGLEQSAELGVEGRELPKSPVRQLFPEPIDPAKRASEITMPPPTHLSQGAIDRRVWRVMEPNSKGQYKVSEEIRKLWYQWQEQGAQIVC